MSRNMASPAYLKLLIIDDDLPYLDIVEEALKGLDLTIMKASHPARGMALFNEHRPEIVLVDYQMPGKSGIEVLQEIIAREPTTEVLLMTGHYTYESAVDAIKKNAADYLTKPLDLELLYRRIETAMKDANRRRKAVQLEDELLQTYQFADFVGRSPLMLNVFATIRRIAPHFRTALVTGATGTGKEHVAHALHHLSPSAHKTFAVCNCSALTETLFESELFGYVRGAFTGATQDKVGLFEYAQGGTVFLDEIGDMPLAGQAKLLRVLQNSEVQRVGSPAVRKVDIRVVAATNKDLRAMVKEGRFREDLFYRLSMVEIKLPSLIERQEDLLLLQRYFVQKFSLQYNKSVRDVSTTAQQILLRHRWPGNLRELENVIGNACMMTQSEIIDVSDLPAYLAETPEENTADDDLLSMEEMQRRHAMKVLRRLGGNKVRAADILGISRTTLYALLKERTDEGESAPDDTPAVQP
jgi:DNA-binding NtrC family response regulator